MCAFFSFGVLYGITAFTALKECFRIRCIRTSFSTVLYHIPISAVHPCSFVVQRPTVELPNTVLNEKKYCTSIFCVGQQLRVLFAASWFSASSQLSDVTATMCFVFTAVWSIPLLMLVQPLGIVLTILFIDPSSRWKRSFAVAICHSFLGFTRSLYGSVIASTSGFCVVSILVYHFSFTE